MNATIYTIPHCPKCSAAKALLKRKGIEFKEFNVTSAEKWGDAQFPIVMLDKLKIEGFAKLKEELK